MTATRLAGQLVGRQRNDPALVEGVVDDLDLDLLDGHRILVDAQHARSLTRRRAQPTGELREVVGGVQPLDRVAPAVVAHQIVPLRDQVAQWTPVVAERNAAVHAPGRLLAQHVMGEVLVDLFPVDAGAAGPAAVAGSRALCTSESLWDQAFAAAMIAVSTSSPVRSASAIACNTRLKSRGITFVKCFRLSAPIRSECAVRPLNPWHRRAR